MTDMLEKVARDIAHFTVDCGGYSSRGDNPNLHSKECNALHQKIITRLDATAESHVVVPRESLKRLIKTAQLLHQNSVGCAIDHHALNFQEQGLPGWLNDCQADIDQARAAIKVEE